MSRFKAGDRVHSNRYGNGIIDKYLEQDDCYEMILNDIVFADIDANEGIKLRVFVSPSNVSPLTIADDCDGCEDIKNSIPCDEEIPHPLPLSSLYVHEGYDCEECTNDVYKNQIVDSTDASGTDSTGSIHTLSSHLIIHASDTPIPSLSDPNIFENDAEEKKINPTTNHVDDIAMVNIIHLEEDKQDISSYDTVAAITTTEAEATIEDVPHDAKSKDDQLFDNDEIEEKSMLLSSDFHVNDIVQTLYGRGTILSMYISDDPGALIYAVKLLDWELASTNGNRNSAIAYLNESSLQQCMKIEKPIYEVKDMNQTIVEYEDVKNQNIHLQECNFSTSMDKSNYSVEPIVNRLNEIKPCPSLIEDTRTEFESAEDMINTSNNTCSNGDSLNNVHQESDHFISHQKCLDSLDQSEEIAQMEQEEKEDEGNQMISLNALSEIQGENNNGIVNDEKDIIKTNAVADINEHAIEMKTEDALSTYAAEELEATDQFQTPSKITQASSQHTREVDEEERRAETENEAKTLVHTITDATSVTLETYLTHSIQDETSPKMDIREESISDMEIRSSASEADKDYSNSQSTLEVISETSSVSMAQHEEKLLNIEQIQSKKDIMNQIEEHQIKLKDIRKARELQEKLERMRKIAELEKANKIMEEMKKEKDIEIKTKIKEDAMKLKSKQDEEKSKRVGDFANVKFVSPRKKN